MCGRAVYILLIVLGRLKLEFSFAEACGTGREVLCFVSVSTETTAALGYIEIYW